MSRFFVLSLNGLTQGAIYAAMALALVLIWRATKVINFALGAMAMFTTYLALFAIDHGAPYWVGFIVALSSGLLLGAIVERVIVRPVESAPPLNVVILTLGLLLFFEALAPMAFGGQIRSFPPAFSIVGVHLGNSQVAFSPFDAFTLGSVLASYIHLHFLSTPTLASAFVRRAARHRETPLHVDGAH